MKKLSLTASCLCGSIKIKTKGYHGNVSNFQNLIGTQKKRTFVIRHDTNK